MECWAHAAARRRQTSNEASLVSSSSSFSSSRKSSSASSASLISSVELEFSLFNDMIRRTPQGRMPHVCVVGAGVAGLRAADVLTRKGIRVTIFEGRDRIGGRVGAIDVLNDFHG